MGEFTLNESEARKRLENLFDDGSFTELDAFSKSAQGEVEAVTGFGTVNGSAVYAFSQNIAVSDGAISVAQCSKIKKIYDLAVKTGCPVVGIYDSNGVILTEGFEVLNAYGEILKASTAMSGVCPQISLIAGSCLGTSALMANMADVVVAVRDADFYVTVPSETTVEESFRAGSVDIMADDFMQAVASVRQLIALLPENNLSPAPIFDFQSSDVLADSGASAVQVIQAIADADSVLELKSGYAANNITALGTVAGFTTGFVAFDGDAVCPYCAYKAEAFVKLCDAYNIPVVTIVNAAGFAKNAENQMLDAVSKLTCAYAAATCPKLSLITENAVGAAYIALAGKGSNADMVFAWDTAVVSPLEADAAVAFLYNDRLADGESREALTKEFKESLASPFTAAACGAVDDIFTPVQTREKVIAALDILSGKRENTLPRKHSVK